MEKEKLELYVLSLSKKQPAQLLEYEAFVNRHPRGSFFQSLRWMELKSNWEHKIFMVKNTAGVIQGTALVLIKKLPVIGKSILYAPRGPVCDYQNKPVLQLLLQSILSLRKKYNGALLRLDPCVENCEDTQIQAFLQEGFRFTPDAGDYCTTQIRHNYILELGKRSAQEIFDSFHSKWRYNILLAQRKGVECRVCGAEALPEFYTLLQATGKRDGFTIRAYSYYEKMLECLGDYCRLYLCYHEGTAISGAVTVQFAGKTSYVYGASSNTHRNLMPNYLMQWTMIQWAVQNHCQIYDFMGIPYFQDETHSNYGVYRFKKGFRGRVMSYAGEFDYILAPVTGRALRWFLERKRSQPAPVSPEKEPAAVTESLPAPHTVL